MPIHKEKRLLPYTSGQMYDLVIDIERYPEFLPWCLGARVKTRKEELIVADLIIGFKVFRERFTSRVIPNAVEQRIDVTYAEGPFKYLENHWVFETHPQGCEIDFYVDFEFRSKLLQRVIEGLFHEAVRRMVAAFETRARDLYGAPEEALSAQPSQPQRGR